MIAEAEAFEGKYEILEKIREGGMGAVYKVRHRLLDEIRVIKVIRPHLSTSPGMNERFLREARLAIRVRHRNIAQLHDFSIDPDGTAYIVMEFIDGLTLADVLARTAPFPLGLALEIARGALGAIGYLHRRDLIHRDVSPDNLMLGRDEDGEPRVTLLDLGIAKSLAASSTLTSTGAFLGKPRYASPEHFGAEGLAAVGPRSDLYSLGVVLYELLTGVCPVQGRDMSSWIAGHLFRPPLGFAESDPEGRVPADLQAILLKALAKAPADRFASAEEMAAALEPVRARFPVRGGDLERALGSLPWETQPMEPPAPGTTQEALDRRFAPLQTPPPRPERVPTLVLQSREELPPLEPPSSQPPAERTKVLPPVTMSDAVTEAPPSRQAGPARRLIPALAALLLVALFLGIWSMMRPREPAPPPPGPVAAAPAPAVPKPDPEPVVASQPPPVTAPVMENPAPVPEPPVEPRVRSVPEARTTPREQPRVEPPKTTVAREERPPERTQPEEDDDTGEQDIPESQPAVSATPERQSEPAAQAPPDDPSSDTIIITNPSAAPSVQETPRRPRPVEPARIINVPKPEYPQEARGSGIYARIYVRVQVSTKGRVTRVESLQFLVRGGGNATLAQERAFQKAAFKAAGQALFVPGRKDGELMTWYVRLKLDFPPE